MKTWRRPPLAIVATMALLVSLMPQLMWACPITGQINATPVMVCKLASATGGTHQAVIPCTHKCCKPVSLPLPPGSDEKSHPTSSIAPAVNGASQAMSPHSARATLIVFAPEVSHFNPAFRVWSARFNHAPPGRSSPYQPAALAGRAPPVL